MTSNTNLLTLLGTAALSTSLVACAADYDLEEVNACEQGVAASSDPYDYEFKARASVATVTTGHEAHIRFKSDAFRSGSKTLNIADGAFDFGFRDTVKAAYAELSNAEIVIEVQEKSIGINRTVQTCTLERSSKLRDAMLRSYNGSVAQGRQDARNLESITFVNADWASDSVQRDADFVFACDGLQPLLSYFEMTFDADYSGAEEAVPTYLQAYTAADPEVCDDSHPDVYDWDVTLQTLHVSETVNDLIVEASLRKDGVEIDSQWEKSNGNFFGTGKRPVRELEWALHEDVDIDDLRSNTLEIKVLDEDDDDRLLADCVMSLGVEQAISAYNQGRTQISFSEMDCRTLDENIQEIGLEFTPKVSDNNIVPVTLAEERYEGGPL